jgi:hypothetical protein
MEDGNKKRNLPIIILAIVAIILFAAAVAAVVITVSSYSTSNGEDVAIEEGITEKVVADEVATEESVASDAGNEATDETVAETVKWDNSSAFHLVCVPAEYMSLRASAGLGDDVITNLYAGTTLGWDGDGEIVDDAEYYIVKVDGTGQQGYVAEKFCVVMDYLYDESALDIVQVSNPLYTYENMVADLETLTERYPDILSKEVVGRSVDGRDIYEVTFGNPIAQKHVMLQASIHGREYMNTQLVMRLLEYYCHYYREGTYHGISYSELLTKQHFT